MKQKPGVMIYFDIIPVLRYLSNEDKGILFEAIMDYGLTGSYGNISDQLRLIWPLVQYKLDLDQNRYDATIIKRKYAAYVRWEKRSGKEPMGYKDWVDSRGYEQYDDTLDAFA